VRKIIEISEISVKKTTFLCKTNPIRQGRNCLIPFYNKALRKIYIFVESQFKPNQSQFLPKRTQTYTVWAIWAILSTVGENGLGMTKDKSR
jgi:hypothetical protein